MKGLWGSVLCFMVMQSVNGDSTCDGAAYNKKCGSEQSSKGTLTDMRCDSGGYYFDRGGRRMFETSYDAYKRGSFNLRRGHLWKERSCQSRRCRRNCRKGSPTETAPQCCSSCPTEAPCHEHYSGQTGLAGWPSASGPTQGQARTKGFPYVATPIWLRDTSDASASGGYATPTSWQGFQ